jgi:hypothetical protein
MLYTFDVVALHVPAVCHGANDVRGAVHVTLLSTRDHDDGDCFAELRHMLQMRPTTQS